MNHMNLCKCLEDAIKKTGTVKHHEKRARSKRMSAKIYRKAAKALELAGGDAWTRGNLCNSHGQVCAVGAMHAITRSENIWFVEHNRFQNVEEEAVRQITGKIGITLLGYNDSADSTLKNVIKIMRRTANLLEHGGKVG